MFLLIKPVFTKICPLGASGSQLKTLHSHTFQSLQANCCLEGAYLDIFKNYKQLPAVAENDTMNH